jgi:hypothetical protein
LIDTFRIDSRTFAKVRALRVRRPLIMREPLDRNGMPHDEPTWLNRSAIILTPKEPYAAWASSVFDEPYETVSDAEGPTVFLGPDADTIDEVAAFVEANFDIFFEHWLFDWCTDPKRWPQNRTLAMFREWFTVRISSMVVDTVREPLVLE